MPKQKNNESEKRTVRFDVNRQKLTLDDLILIDEVMSGELDLKMIRPLRDMLARFLVDDAGKPIEATVAKTTIGACTLDELSTITTAFGESISKNAIDPQNGGE